MSQIARRSYQVAAVFTHLVPCGPRWKYLGQHVLLSDKYVHAFLAAGVDFEASETCVATVFLARAILFAPHLQSPTFFLAWVLFARSTG